MPSAATLRPKPEQCPVAGVGASSGDLEAFKALLNAMPANPGIALVLVADIGQSHNRNLQSSLAKATALPVHQVKDGLALQPDHIYIARADRRITLSRGVLRTRDTASKSPVDDFFRSLSADLGNRAVGIVFAGVASDGFKGMEAIRAAGGITFAQDQQSAGPSGGNSSATAAGCVDFVLPPAKIAAALGRLSFPQHSEEVRNSLRRICATLRGATGVDFELYKPTLIQSRVLRRMALKSISNIGAYTRLLQFDRTELDALYEEILFHKTDFFRDTGALRVLRGAFLPRMRKARASGQTIRVWAPGCASGEEAYTVAMLLCEMAGKSESLPRIQLFGTDISESYVDHARNGVYCETAMSGVSAARRNNFFVKVRQGYQIGKVVRNMCIFAKHDLTRDPPFSRLDLIVCRNVLLDMESVLQAHVLKTFHYALLPDSFLILDKSENLAGSTGMFATHETSNRLYTSSRSVTSPQGTTSLAPGSGQKLSPSANPIPSWVFNSRRETERIILERYVPASLLVDSGLNVVHLFGDASPYLAPPSGEACFQLLRMVRVELAAALRSMIQEANTGRVVVRREGLRFKSGAASAQVDVEVEPLPGFTVDNPELLIVFRPSQPLHPASVGQGEIGGLLSDVNIPLVTLDGARRIRSFNEAATQVFSLIASDIGRPLSDITSRVDIADWDELVDRALSQQGLIECETRDRRGHWFTLRIRPIKPGGKGGDGVLIALLDIDSLKRSLHEARSTGDFAHAIIDSLREPLLVLDDKLCVVSATPSFYETFMVTHAETEGRSLFELGDGQWNIPRLRTLMENLLLHGSRIEKFEVAREFPGLGYRNIALNARQISGQQKGTRTILLTIEDVTERAQMEERLRIREMNPADASTQAILSVDQTGRIVMANRVVETMFGYTADELLELTVEALIPDRFRRQHVSQRDGYFAAPKLRPMGHSLALTGKRKNGTEFPIEVGLSHMRTAAGMVAVAFVTDLSERLQAEDALRESEQRFSLFMTHLPAAAFMKDTEGRYVYVNPGFAKLAAMPPSQCVGRTDRDFWPELAQHLREQDQRAIQTRGAITSETERAGDGKRRCFRTVRFPIPNAAGDPSLVAGIAVDVTDRRAAEIEQQLLLARLDTAREDERRRISGEIHDDLTQRLAGLAMDLGQLASEQSGSASARKKSLRALQRRVVQAAEISRHIAHELHPHELDDLGLVAALKFYCEDFSRRENIDVGFVSDSVPRGLNRETASCIYKVTRESLTNVVKHADTNRASVRLEGTAESVTVQIKDSGAGFRVGSLTAAGGLGLLSMKERVELLRGEFRISSEPHQGTEVVAVLPLTIS